jgi:hypothetical protein
MDEFYDVIHQDDRVYDPHDYLLHFTPLSMDARAQRIERRILIPLTVVTMSLQSVFLFLLLERIISKNFLILLGKI